jgi:hypothetical protein
MTTDETLYTGEVTNIATLIESFDFPLEAFVLMEQMPREVIGKGQAQLALLRFVRFQDLKNGIDITSYMSGRVFNPDFELRWEQDALTPGKTSVVYIGADRKLPGLTKSNTYTVQPENEDSPTKNKKQGRQYYLFGELLDETKQGKMGIVPENGYQYYAETRVPRLLLYPEIKKEDGKSPDRLQLIVREYRLVAIDPQTPQKPEEDRTYRFVNLVAPEDKEEKQA